MNTLIEPNLHPIFVHFVVGLLFTGAIAHAVTAFAPQEAGWRGRLQAAADWMLGLGILAAVGAVIAGFDAYYSVAHDADSHAAMTTHRNWALTAAALFTGLGAWRFATRKSAPGALFALASLAAAALLTVTAWWGGKLVFEHGVGVQRLPEAHGEGHDHEHPGSGHDEGEPETGHAQDEGHAHDEGGGQAHDGDGAGHAAEGEDHAHDESAVPAVAGTPEATADAFLEALRTGDADRVGALLAEDVLILEGGGAERSLDEYASHHMNSDMAFMQAVSSQRLSRSTRIHGDTAWVASEYALRGSYQGRDIAVKSQETLVLRREGEGWLIDHIHWSNTPLPDMEETAEPAQEDAETEHDHGDHEH